MDKLCEVPNCGRAHYARGVCRAHYKRWHKTGDVRADEPLGRYSAAQVERTSAKLRGRKRGPMPDSVRAAISAAKKGRPNGLLGYKHSEATKLKMSVAHRGERGGNWSGDMVGYIAMHERARKVIGAECVHCGATNRIEAALKHDHEGEAKFDEMTVGGKVRAVRYSTVPTDYMALCVPCHRKYDLANGPSR